MFYTRAFLSSTLSRSLFALNFKSAFTLSFSCKSPPEWIFSHLLNQAFLFEFVDEILKCDHSNKSY